MSVFMRGLHPDALESLRQLTSESGENWWKDLISVWKPSGSVARVSGLRLALRHNYLNFYSRGQSVARVGFSRACQPYVETHVKYVFGPDEDTQACALRTSGRAMPRKPRNSHHPR
jgi:hypothetical protein